MAKISGTIVINMQSRELLVTETKRLSLYLKTKVNVRF